MCDVGNGACRTTDTQKAAVQPGEVYLDPAKHYYISILPGDAANDAARTPSHGMGGAQVAAKAGVFAPVDVFVQPHEFPTAKISVLRVRGRQAAQR